MLLTNRASAKRSRYGSTSSAGRGEPKGGLHSDARCKSVPLSSITSDKKSPVGNLLDASDSQEDMLKPEGNARFVVVKHDIVSLPVLHHPFAPVAKAIKISLSDAFRV